MTQASKATRLDLLDWPLLGRFLRWRHASTALRVPVLILLLLVIIHGLAGPQLAPKNLATVLTWLHFRGLLVLGLLLIGNLFCMACPFILVQRWVRRIFQLNLPTPRWSRRKWPAVVLFILLLFSYELFDLWSSPAWTAVLLLIYLAAAVVLGVLFRGAPFCSAACPLGQFSLVSSTVSPFEVQVRDSQVCAACTSRDCMRGREGAQNTLPGCELGIFQPRKRGNMNCHFRLDCLRACPYDNVGLRARLPGSELWAESWRSGIGRFFQRTDIATLAAVYTFGALLNAFGMISPVYTLENWLAGLLGLRPELGLLAELPVLGILFVVGLVVIPAGLLLLTGWWSRLWSGSHDKLSALIARYAYALVPMGFGVWVAHFAFHFLTGVLTIIPVCQSILIDQGLLSGRPRWDLGPILPIAWLYPVELGFLGLGWLGSLLVAYRLAEQDQPRRPWRAFLPWALLLALLLAAAAWLMAQPMEMRGTFFA